VPGRARIALSVLLALLAVPAAGCTEAARIDLGGTVTGATEAVPERVALEVSSELPSWLAPGGRLVVAGSAAPGVEIVLESGGRVIARGTVARDGGFDLVAAAPGEGRHRLSVEAAGERVDLGRLRVRPLVLAAAGDVTPGDAVAAAVAAHGPRHPWLSVAPLLREADIATANLEGVVSERGSPWPGKTFHFRGPPEMLRAAAGFAGVDVFTVANNHSLDFGYEAFLDTLRTARRLGLETLGGGRNLAQARRPAVVEAGGLRIAFLGYDDIQPDFHATGGRAGTAPAEPALIRADVRAARERADLVVVWFHWGIERATLPSARQVELAQAALRAGAALVLGAHPHVLQPIERRGRRLVAWSLGNFVFEPHSALTDRTGVLLVRLGAGGVLGHSFRPARIVGVQPRLS
jgi:poly-gamma-glutamate synthesis protein (capsule biosynthesis protein)